jgi:hypothetical protein
MLPVAKQLLPLPACDNTPILDRTLRQLWKLTVCRPDDKHLPVRVEVVGWMDMIERYLRTPVRVDAPGNLIRELSLAGTPFWFSPGVGILADPGNSSLKGIARYLTKIATDRGDDEHTVVLLGDVVYSMHCLETLLTRHAPIMFAGTSDLSTSGGELWGVSWRKECERTMMTMLGNALAKHPPFHDTYQPGQMRRWYWALDQWMRSGGDCVPPRPWYVAVDDFTRDIDLPEHVAALPALSERAAQDDKNHGMEWEWAGRNQDRVHP